MQSANIKVAVRVRPLLPQETQQGHTTSKLKVDLQTKSINAFNERMGADKNAAFDYVLDTNASQKELYKTIGMSQMIKAVTEGYHATIFAYGQTGSGKTFTMEGYKYKQNEKGIPTAMLDQGENDGIVPRSINTLFDLIKQQNGVQSKKFTVSCSYFQVYKEKIYDLLNKSQLKRLQDDGPGLKLKWSKQDQFTVENLYTFECKSPEDILALYHFGIKNKVVASHNMNNSSSRSHSILSIAVEQIDEKNPDNIILSKLQLVDLAGSERQSQTGNTANKESIDINKSLFTLRQVITALTDQANNQKSSSYVPYRDSKLTSLLRQSLGGNSYCLMIACLNPCDAYIEENLSTLQYASRASHIHNKPIKNDDPKSRLIEDLKSQVKMLTEQLGKANETIQFLSQITGNNPQAVSNNVKTIQSSMYPTNQGLTQQQVNTINKIVLQDQSKEGIKAEEDYKDSRAGTASSALTENKDSELRGNQTRLIKDKDNIEKFFKEKSEALQSIAKGQGIEPSSTSQGKDAITERIIHTVNMMKEVLQSNLSLRETIQKQSEVIDDMNTQMFQIQNENEDIRDRMITLEDLTGKDSATEVHRLVTEKKALEHRVKNLESNNNTWNQFQATRQQFHQSKEKLVNQSQLGVFPKATLNNKFNDDYEPMRCTVVNEESGSGFNRDAVPRTTGSSNKKKKRGQHQNYQNQGREKSAGPQTLTAGSNRSYTNLDQQLDKHQEYKIRTVRSLAQAYQQQQNVKRNNKGLPSSNRLAYADTQGTLPNNMSFTAYNPSNNQCSDQQYFEADMKSSGLQGNRNYDQFRSKSPVLRKQQAINSQKKTHKTSLNVLQKQGADSEQKGYNFFPSDFFQREKSQAAQPHVTLRKTESSFQNSGYKPPRAAIIGSRSNARASNKSVKAKVFQDSRRSLNTSANVIQQNHSLERDTHTPICIADGEGEKIVVHDIESDINADSDGNFLKSNGDPYLALSDQQLSRVNQQQKGQKDGPELSNLNVSLPHINNN